MFLRMIAMIAIGIAGACLASIVSSTVLAYAIGVVTCGLTLFIAEGI